jgi:hypothetical protein
VEASFGRKVSPQELTEDNQHDDRLELGELTKSMISRRPHQLDNPAMRQKMLSMSSSGKCLEVQNELSPELVDFLEMCFVKSGSIPRLLKASTQCDSASCHILIRNRTRSCIKDVQCPWLVLSTMRSEKSREFAMRSYCKLFEN